MCDYSLEVYGSRPAREGERYVTSRFPSGTIGLTSPELASTAVCLNCDTALEISGIPDVHVPRASASSLMKTRSLSGWKRAPTGTAYVSATALKCRCRVSRQAWALR